MSLSLLFVVSFLATTSADTTVNIWQTADFCLKKTLKETNQRWVWDCAFSEDSQYLITGIIYTLNVFDHVSFCSCTKLLRNVDHLTLDVPFSRTDIFKNSFFVRICCLWNNLPLSPKESNTLPIFRKNFAFYYDKINVDFFKTLHCILPSHWSIHGNF